MELDHGRKGMEESAATTKLYQSDSDVHVAQRLDMLAVESLEAIGYRN
jgi:hypothetical protein